MQIAPAWQLALLCLTALAYGGATIGMKLASDGVSTIAFGLIALCFAAAAIAEVVLLRNSTLGRLYFAVVAVETLIVITYSVWIGEHMSPRELVGAALVLGGLIALQA